MSEFLSAVVTPQGLSWCEAWSHSETRHRLGNPEDAVDVEYDEQRGFEMHERFRFPDWFNVSAVATKCKQLYNQILPLVNEFQQRRTALDDEINERWTALLNEIKQQRDAVYIEFYEQPAVVDNEYQPRRDALEKEFYKQRAALDDEYQQRQAALNAEFELLWSAIAGYVPVCVEED